MKKIRLKIESGNRILAGQLDLHEELSPRYFCILAHCFTCTKDLKSMKFLNDVLTEKGFAVLRFDFTGLGDSTGDFCTSKFETNIEDLLAVSDFLAENYEAPSLLIGHSLGGAAVIKAAQLIQSVKAVVTIGTPYFPDHLARIIRKSKPVIEKEGKAEVLISGRNFVICDGFYNDVNEEQMIKNIEELHKPILIMHSPEDKTVGIEHAINIFNRANQPKSLISLDKADHLLLNKKDAKYTANLIAVWASKYL